MKIGLLLILAILSPLIGHAATEQLPPSLKAELNRLNYTAANIGDAIVYYDRHGKRLGLEAKTEAYCEKQPRRFKKVGDDHILEIRNKECRDFIKSKRAITKSPAFLNLAGWTKSGAMSSTRKYRNNDLSRTIRSESESPVHALKVNFTEFVSNPQYKCRRPSLYNYFTKVFNYGPYSYYRCNTQNKLPITEFKNGKNRISYNTINSKYIYQIHYLMAGEGEQMMSRWGHAMLRLVRCAPFRKEIGPACLEDTDYHIVVSFVADVDELMINGIKGIFGRYRSVLRPMTYSQAVKRYELVENRQLHSYPLDLSRNEKELMIGRILELYWQYKGDYYFFSSNCAGELVQLLASSRIDNIHLQAAKNSTPEGVLDSLREVGLITADGMRYSEEELAAESNENEKSSNKYLMADYQSLSAADRAKYYLTNFVATRNTLQDFLLFEELELNRVKTLSVQKLLKDSDSEEREEISQLSKSLTHIIDQIQRGRVIEGYGIPQIREVIKLKGAAAKEKTQKAMAIERRLLEMQAKANPELIEELKLISQNMLTIHHLLKEQ